jgi:hypothetical protein
MKRRADIYKQDINCNSTGYVVRRCYTGGTRAVSRPHGCKPHGAMS